MKIIPLQSANIEFIKSLLGKRIIDPITGKLNFLIGYRNLDGGLYCIIEYWDGPYLVRDMKKNKENILPEEFSCYFKAKYVKFDLFKKYNNENNKTKK